MKRIYVCAPLGKNIPSDLQNARQYASFVLQRGAAPVVPHFYVDLVDRDERALCRRAGKSLLWMCDECWVFGDHVTRTMKEELQFCKHLNIKIRYFTGGTKRD